MTCPLPAGDHASGTGSTYVFVVTIMAYCDWDPRKDALNRRKHGVSFDVAASVLDDQFALLAFDRNVGGEDRWRMIGRAASGAVLVLAVVISEHGAHEAVRIISARHALRQERLNYECQER